jgi:hypothetical protein
VSDIFICGKYDRAAKTLTSLMLVLTRDDELKQNYSEGDIIYVGSRVYKLGQRSAVVNSDVIQYELVVVKASTS